MSEAFGKLKEPPILPGASGKDRNTGGAPRQSGLPSPPCPRRAAARPTHTPSSFPGRRCMGSHVPTGEGEREARDALDAA